jgi:hypothetical protein
MLGSVTRANPCNVLARRSTNSSTRIPEDDDAHYASPATGHVRAISGSWRADPS